MTILSTANTQTQYLKFLSYGSFGTGKTYFAGSMAKRFKTLFISAEGGTLSLRNIKDDNGKTIPIDYEPIEKFEDLEMVYHRLRNRVKLPTGEDYSQYGAVAIDSITEIQKKCMDSILERSKNEALEMRDWGVLANRIERMVRSFRDLPMHLAVTALEEAETDKLTGEVRVWPYLKGSVQYLLPSFFDEVFYHYGKDVAGEDGKHEWVPFILTRNSGKYQGKDRSGRLPVTMAKPEFGTVFDLIFKEDE